VASTVSQQNYYFDSSPVYTRHKDWKEATVKASMKKEGPIQITRQSSKTGSTSVTVDQQKYVVQVEKLLHVKRHKEKRKKSKCSQLS
jgi:hypothetical protein